MWEEVLRRVFPERFCFEEPIRVFDRFGWITLLEWASAFLIRFWLDP